MKKLLPLLVCVLFLGSAYSHDLLWFSSEIGDLDVLLLRGYTHARPIEVNLAPTNAPVSNAVYSVECQLIYRNEGVLTADSREEQLAVLDTIRVLNRWLEDFMLDQYAGADYNRLLANYYDEASVGHDINMRFPEFVRMKLAEIDESIRPKIEIVFVKVRALGALQKELLRLRAADRGE